MAKKSKKKPNLDSLGSSQVVTIDFDNQKINYGELSGQRPSWMNWLSENNQILATNPAVSTSIYYKITQEVELENSIRELEYDLSTALKRANESEKEKKEFKKKYDILKRKMDLADVLNRVCDKAKDKLLNDPDFSEELLKEKLRKAFVLSIDIRRSLENAF